MKPFQVGLPVMAAYNISDAADTLKYLDGTWEYWRTITGGTTVPMAKMHGDAWFRRVDDITYDYHENGLNTLLNGATLNAYRSYRYVADGDTLYAHYADGPDIGNLFEALKVVCAPMHDVSLQGTCHCKDDVYETTYVIAEPARFRVVHHVTGPAKDYTSDTLYQRAAVSPSP